MLLYNLYNPISLILSCWLNECPIYIWRPVGEYPESSGVSSGVRIKLNLWGCISCREASDFVTFSNNMDQYNYLEILAGDFLPFAKTTYGDNFILQRVYAICKKNEKGTQAASKSYWSRWLDLLFDRRKQGAQIRQC